MIQRGDGEMQLCQIYNRLELKQNGMNFCSIGNSGLRNAK